MTLLMRRGTGGGQVRTLRDEMDRLFDSFTGMAPARSEGTGALWSPAVDVREDSDNFYVEAELPGMSKDDIELEVENNVLMLKGERRFERKEEKEDFHFIERSYGSFYRSFALPKNVDGENISAGYKDGVLTVALPKKDEVKPRRVSIS